MHSRGLFHLTQCLQKRSFQRVIGTWPGELPRPFRIWRPRRPQCTPTRWTPSAGSGRGAENSSQLVRWKEVGSIWEAHPPPPSRSTEGSVSWDTRTSRQARGCSPSTVGQTANSELPSVRRMNGRPGAWIGGDLIRRKIARRPRGRDPDLGVSAREILKGTASREMHRRRDVDWNTLEKRPSGSRTPPQRDPTRGEARPGLRGALDSGKGEKEEGRGRKPEAVSAQHFSSEQSQQLRRGAPEGRTRARVKVFSERKNKEWPREGHLPTPPFGVPPPPKMG